MAIIFTVIPGASSATRAMNEDRSRSIRDQDRTLRSDRAERMSDDVPPRRGDYRGLSDKASECAGNVN